MLAWRRDTPSDRVVARAAFGARLADTLAAQVPCPGGATASRTYWLFPVLVSNPDAVIGRLRSAGFDATTGASSLGAVAPPPERPEARAPNASWIASHLLFVPCYPELPPSALERLAAVLLEEGRQQPLARPATRPGDAA